MLVKSAFMIKPVEVDLWGAGWHIRQQTDIATYRLKQPRGGLNENISHRTLLNLVGDIVEFIHLSNIPPYQDKSEDFFLAMGLYISWKLCIFSN